MRIDYCPNCNKAGLKQLTEDGLDQYGDTQEKRYNDFKQGIKTIHDKKWCPRCLEWIEPVNIPYIGSKGRG